MTWEHRVTQLHLQLAKVNSDVICLQEVQKTHFEGDFLAYMRTLGYDGVVQDSNHHVGVATFFKTSKFTMEWSESRSRAMLVGLTMQVQVDSTDAVVSVPVMVGTVHLEGHPRHTAKRFTQMKSLLKRCEARMPAMTNPQEALVFICGDFNDGVEAGAVRVLEDGELSPNFTENGVQTTPTHFSHPFRFTNAYPAALRHPTYPNTLGGGAIDHLFAQATLVDTVGVLSIRQREMEEMVHTKVPNMTYPSDHLPVGAVFQLNHKTLDLLRRKAFTT